MGGYCARIFSGVGCRLVSGLLWCGDFVTRWCIAGGVVCVCNLREGVAECECLSVGMRNGYSVRACFVTCFGVFLHAAIRNNNKKKIARFFELQHRGVARNCAVCEIRAATGRQRNARCETARRRVSFWLYRSPKRTCTRGVMVRRRTLKRLEDETDERTFKRKSQCSFTSCKRHGVGRRRTSCVFESGLLHT